MSFEAHVWCENGDLLGWAEVGHGEIGYYVIFHVCPDDGPEWSERVIDFTTELGMRQAASEAEDYAKHWAAAYEEYWQAQCTCGESDCGVMTLHGIYVQYVRDGFDVDQ